MPDSQKIMYLFDARNRFTGVFVAAEIWNKIATLVENALAEGVEAKELPSALADFENLMRYWDFPYAYDPAVTCPNCKASVENWRESDDFLLRNANLGGLLVFRCGHCGALVRHKYFKDRIAVECDPC